MTGSDIENDVVKSKFYYSFLELSNGRVISIQAYYGLQADGIFGEAELQIMPTSCYDFDEDFNEWWQKTFSYDDVERGQEDLTELELSVSSEFYLYHIEPNKDFKIDAVLMN